MSPLNHISIDDIRNEIKDWIIILAPLIIANQAIVNNFIMTYIHIPAEYIAIAGAFCFFLYQKMKQENPITATDIVNEAIIISKQK